jgi:hypothetical protein
MDDQRADGRVHRGGDLVLEPRELDQVPVGLLAEVERMCAVKLRRIQSSQAGSASEAISPSSGSGRATRRERSESSFVACPS